jgi:PAS domain S-box-containing protein
MDDVHRMGYNSSQREGTMPLTILIIIFLAVSLCVSAVYLILLSDKDEHFLQYWAFSWIAYSFSLLCVILFTERSLPALLGIRDIFDLLNILFLMLSTYSFSQVRIPKYWQWSALAIGIWGLVGILAGFNMFTQFIPIAVYEAAATVVILHLVLTKWPRTKLRRLLAAALFCAWGFGKAASSIFELLYQIPTTLYMTEFLFSNLVNYAIIIIFMHRSVEMITRSERELRIIADNASDIVFFYELQPKPHYAFMSPAVEDITGYTREDYFNDRFLPNEKAAPEDREEFTALFDPETYYEEGAPYTKSLVFSFLHKNGTRVWCEIKTTLIFDRGTPSGIVGIVRDISVLKMAEQDLIASRETRNRLLSYISHELRIPMTAIMGYIEALRDGVISSEQGKNDAMDTIFNKAHMLEQLINDLFSLTKFEGNQVSMNLTMNDTYELSQYLANIHTEKEPPSGISVTAELGPNALRGFTVVADRERINQVVANLIINAKKFSKSGDNVTLIFGIDTPASGMSDERLEGEAAGVYRVSVKDEGVGISKEDIPYVFERFFSKSSTRGFSGAGIGLTLSKEVIEAHKGRLTVESVEGKGSIFTFTLPLYFAN